RPSAPTRPVDMCKASENQPLVGRPRTEIPVPVNPSDQRVACTTCPVTQDYNPRRLNFFFDADTGLIAEVRCG
ncbi:MAG TPA: peptidase inhibitor I78, partial [Phenylobacterium sp.]